MKLKTSIPVSNTIQLCLFEDNTLACRVSTRHGLLEGWRASDYPENPAAAVIDDVDGQHEAAFQDWREAELEKLLGSAKPKSEPEPVKLSDAERITILEHAVQKLMDDKKNATASDQPAPKGLFGRPARSMAEAVQAALDQEAAERYRAFRQAYSPPPFVDEMPGEVEQLLELLISLGYRVTVVPR